MGVGRMGVAVATAGVLVTFGGPTGAGVGAGTEVPLPPSGISTVVSFAGEAILVMPTEISHGDSKERGCRRGE
jgi:hypothetical protein